MFQFSKIVINTMKQRRGVGIFGRTSVVVEGAVVTLLVGRG